MESFLGGTIGEENSDLSNYTINFFEKHVDRNALWSLLQCTDQYLNTLWFLYNSEDQELDREMPNKIKIIGESHAELKNLESGIDLLRRLNLNALRADYEQGLSEIIENKMVISTYIDYVFKVIEEEIQVLLDTYEVSKQFVLSADKENRFLVPELMLKNSQIYIIESLNHVAYHDISHMGNVLGNGNSDFCNGIAEKYLELKPFMDKLYQYVNHYQVYLGREKDRGEVEYKALFREAGIIISNHSKIARDDSKRMPYNCMIKIFEKFNSGFDLTNRVNYEANYDISALSSDEEEISFGGSGIKK